MEIVNVDTQKSASEEQTHHDRRRRASFTLDPILPAAPTLPNVRTSRLLTHGMQAEPTQVLLDRRVGRARRDLGFQVGRQAWPVRRKPQGLAERSQGTEAGAAGKNARLEIAHRHPRALRNLLATDEIIKRRPLIEPARECGGAIRGGGGGGRCSRRSGRRGCRRSERACVCACKGCDAGGHGCYLLSALAGRWRPLAELVHAPLRCQDSWARKQIPIALVSPGGKSARAQSRAPDFQSAISVPSGIS